MKDKTVLQLHATGGRGPYTWSLNREAIAAGFSITSDGIFSGPVLVAKVMASDGSTSERPLTIGVIADTEAK